MKFLAGYLLELRLSLWGSVHIAHGSAPTNYLPGLWVEEASLGSLPPGKAQLWLVGGYIELSWDVFQALIPKKLGPEKEKAACSSPQPPLQG